MDAHFQNGLTEDIPTLINGDCDIIFTSGHYYIGSSGTNKPGAGLNGWLTVKAYDDGSYCYQEYVTYQGHKYYRMRDNGTWQPWISADVKVGTWTPTLSGSVTYSTRSGQYIKIGNMVWINCDITLSSKGSTSTALSISGLPFTPSARCALSESFDWATKIPQVAFAEKENYIRLICNNEGNWNTMTHAYITDKFHVIVSGCYQTS